MTQGQRTADPALVETLFKAGAHFGYSRARRHASVRAHLYGAKNGVDIIDLEGTVAQLDTAKTFLSDLGKAGKTVLFVGTKPEIRDIVERAASSIGMPMVTERWVGGTLTNWSEIKKRIARLKELTEKFAKGDLEKYTKKERLLFDRELAKLKAEFGGIASLEAGPAALCVIDPREEHIAIEEAQKMKVPVVALLNSDCDMREITYPVLANDSALESVRLVVTAFADAYQDGVKHRGA
jgi:small subunit ribosomal protein S2